MNRFDPLFKNKKPFVSYLTAGDGGMKHSLDCLLALLKAGVDILEVGVPFSDPVADGPVIQRAMQRALEQGTTLSGTLELISQVRQRTKVPIVLFSYYNPILAAQERGIYKKINQSGVDAVLVVDLPIEEAQAHIEQCQRYDMAPIFLVTPDTKPERVKQINQYGQGFLYYVCFKGTTGARSSLPDGFGEAMRRIKQAASLPVVAGFGIATAQMAQEVCKHADGFVVGSRLVQAVEQGVSPDELGALAKTLRERI